MPYEEPCNILNWPLLSTCRTYFSLVECYKIVFGLSHLDFQEVFEFVTVHSRELITLFINFFKNLQKLTVSSIFFIRVVSDWNSLSKDIVEAGTLELFKSRLKLDRFPSFLFLCNLNYFF